MKQKTFVADLDIGMYVCELDRPWSEAPFEPPFDVQGFYVSSADELEKVRALCDYVYVDDRAVDAPVAAVGGVGGRPVPLRGLDTDSARHGSWAREKRSGNIRYLPSLRYRPDLLAPRGTDHDLPERRNDYEPVTRMRRGKRLRAEEPVGDRTPAEQQSHKLRRRAPRSADDGKSDRRVRTTEHVLSLFSAPRTDQVKQVYADRCSVEEELSVAQQIATDTEAVYRRVLKDIRAGRELDVKAVKQTVKGLVGSVIRNPDALTWLVRLKSRRHYTYSHSMAVCVLALAMGRYLGLSKTDLRAIGMGTLLQDIGKLHVPRRLLNKSGKLTSAEMKVVSKHVGVGVEMLRKTRQLSTEALDIVMSHHERFDGSGYPRAMHGDQISPFSALAGMADTYEAMTSQRPYRNALTSLETLTHLYNARDQAFPAAMVEHLIHCIGVFPVGSFVLLNTGSVGVVVSRNRVQQLKPKVLPILDAEGNRFTNAETIDLAEEKSTRDDIPWKISRVVDPEDYALNPAEFFA